MDGGEKKIWIIANFKANKSISEVLEWIEQVGPNIPRGDYLRVILAPRASVLAEAKKCIKVNGFQLELSSQNISQFGLGAFTGEEPAELLKDLIDYSIVGHSERRSNFHESDADIEKKVLQLKSFNLEPILCVPDDNTMIPNGVKVVAYEPTFAIGEGKEADTPENANEVASKIRLKSPGLNILYGGSVNKENAKNFLKMSDINGLLIGRASLDPLEFIAILNSL